MDIFAAITGAIALLLSIALAAREVVRSRQGKARQQAEAISVTAEFIDSDGDNPICRVVCHNKSAHAVTDVYAYVVWEATTEWPDGSVGPSQCLDIVGFHGVAPEFRAERQEILMGNPIEPPVLVPGPFPVKFTFTDASRVRWERGLDGKLRKNPVEMLGNRLDDGDADKPLNFWQRRKMHRVFD